MSLTPLGDAEARLITSDAGRYSRPTAAQETLRLKGEQLAALGEQNAALLSSIEDLERQLDERGAREHAAETRRLQVEDECLTLKDRLAVAAEQERERACAEFRETLASKDAQLSSMGAQNTELLALLKDEERRATGAEAVLKEAKIAARRTAEEARRARDHGAAELETLRGCLASAQQREKEQRAKLDLATEEGRGLRMQVTALEHKLVLLSQTNVELHRRVLELSRPPGDDCASGCGGGGAEMDQLRRDLEREQVRAEGAERRLAATEREMRGAAAEHAAKFARAEEMAAKSLALVTRLKESEAERDRAEREASTASRRMAEALKAKSDQAEEIRTLGVARRKASDAAKKAQGEVERLEVRLRDAEKRTRAALGSRRREANARVEDAEAIHKLRARVAHLTSKAEVQQERAEAARRDLATLTRRLAESNDDCADARRKLRAWEQSGRDMVWRMHEEQQRRERSLLVEDSGQPVDSVPPGIANPVNGGATHVADRTPLLPLTPSQIAPISNLADVVNARPFSSPNRPNDPEITKRSESSANGVIRPATFHNSIGGSWRIDESAFAVKVVIGGADKSAAGARVGAFVGGSGQRAASRLRGGNSGEGELPISLGLHEEAQILVCPVDHVTIEGPKSHGIDGKRTRRSRSGAARGRWRRPSSRHGGNLAENGAVGTSLTRGGDSKTVLKCEEGPRRATELLERFHITEFLRHAQTRGRGAGASLRANSSTTPKAAATGGSAASTGVKRAGQLKVLEIAAHKLCQVMTALLLSEADHERCTLEWRAERVRLEGMCRVHEHRHAVIQERLYAEEEAKRNAILRYVRCAAESGAFGGNGLFKGQRNNIFDSVPSLSNDDDGNDENRSRPEEHGTRRLVDDTFPTIDGSVGAVAGPSVTKLSSSAFKSGAPHLAVGRTFELCLSNCGVGDEEAHALSAILLGDEIRSTDADSVDLNADSNVPPCTSLERLSTLALNSNAITDVGVAPLAHVVTKSQALSSIDLRDNAIGRRGIFVLASALERNVRVQQVHVDGAAGIITAIGALYAPTVTSSSLPVALSGRPRPPRQQIGAHKDNPKEFDVAFSSDVSAIDAGGSDTTEIEDEDEETSGPDTGCHKMGSPNVGSAKVQTNDPFPHGVGVIVTIDCSEQFGGVEERRRERSTPAALAAAAAEDDVVESNGTPSRIQKSNNSSAPSLLGASLMKRAGGGVSAEAALDLRTMNAVRATDHFVTDTLTSLEALDDGIVEEKGGYERNDDVATRIVDRKIASLAERLSGAMGLDKCTSEGIALEPSGTKPSAERTVGKPEHVDSPLSRKIAALERELDASESRRRTSGDRSGMQASPAAVRRLVGEGNFAEASIKLRDKRRRQASSSGITSNVQDRKTSSANPSLSTRAFRPGSRRQQNQKRVATTAAAARRTEAIYSQPAPLIE